MPEIFISPAILGSDREASEAGPARLRPWIRPRFNSPLEVADLLSNGRAKATFSSFFRAILRIPLFYDSALRFSQFRAELRLPRGNAISAFVFNFENWKSRIVRRAVRDSPRDRKRVPGLCESAVIGFGAIKSSGERAGTV